MPADKQDDTAIRATLQTALRQTFDDLGVSAIDLARRSGIPPATISGLRNGRRAVYTYTFQSILDALSSDEYAYFLELLGRPEELLEEVEPRLIQSSLANDPDLRKAAFFQLVAAFCSNCSPEEQVELLDQIYLASVVNPRLQ
jgi:transcriptional regulator with XRE-family HTH domain